MTGREFSEVDIDLLADYVGGALDGTPDEARVAALIADDPAWRATHDSLTVGMASVGAELRALGAEPMPDDIAVRLSAALSTSVLDLRDATPDDDAVADDAVADDAVLDVAVLDVAVPGGRADVVAPGGVRRLSSVPTGGGPGRDGRDGATAAARRRRLRRWSAPIAAAAGLAAFAGVGVNYLLNGAADSASDTAASGAYPANAPMLNSAEAGAQEAAPAAGRIEALPPPAQITVSGIDYRRDTLSAEPAMNAATDASKREQAPAPGEAVARDSAAPALQRLSGRTAMLACLDAIAQMHGGPISVATVDYARYEGSPALVVRFTATDGRWAYAAGPDCGLPDADADTLGRVQVG